MYSLHMHFNDCLKCEAPLETADIQALTIAKTLLMKEGYLEPYPFREGSMDRDNVIGVKIRMNILYS